MNRPKIRVVAYLEPQIRDYVIRRAKYLNLSRSAVIGEMLEGSMEVV